MSLLLNVILPGALSGAIGGIVARVIHDTVSVQQKQKRINKILSYEIKRNAEVLRSFLKDDKGITTWVLPGSFCYTFAWEIALAECLIPKGAMKILYQGYSAIRALDIYTKYCLQKENPRLTLSNAKGLIKEAAECMEILTERKEFRI